MFKQIDIKNLFLKNKRSKIKSFSQAGQDKFVLKMLNNKKNGKYIEIGAFDPIKISNTYILEKEYNWSGFSLDIEQNVYSLMQQSLITKMK